MTSLKDILFLIACIVVILPASSQDWEWEWGANNTQKDEATWSFMMDIDFLNNVYIGSQYGDSISFGDTVFNHSGAGYYEWANWAIGKYNNQGKLQNAIDITTIPGKIIFGVDLVVDSDLNVYIACQFQQQINLQDTIIYHGNVPVPDAPELFLAKLTPSLEVEWIRLISGPHQDECNGLVVSSDGNVYMATRHYGYGGSVYTVNFFGQDSTTHELTTCQLLKISPQGNLVWRKEMFAENSGTMIGELNLGINDNIYLNGYTFEDLNFSGEIVTHPHPYQYLRRPFLLKVDELGELTYGMITDWSMVISDTDVDELGNFYFAGFVWDTLVFGPDTLIQHEDSTVNILAKLDPDFNPVWHETTKVKSEQGSYYFHIDSYFDTLFFAGRCRGIFPMFDTVFTLGQYYESFVGQVSPQGELENYIFTHSHYGFKPYGLQLDNCNNLMMSGSFKGHTYLGQDTLASSQIGKWDGAITKINRYGAGRFSFGQDTIVCDSIILTGQEGYENYYWNGVVSDQNKITITETGEYIFACHTQEGCWLRDTIYITVEPGFDVNLGQDTIMTSQDTIALSVSGEYDNYFWSTGATSASIEIIGSDWGTGNWDIWVEVIHGACSAIDTIQITVLSALPELREFGIELSPNPVQDKLLVSSEKAYRCIEIIDINGEIIVRKDEKKQSNSLQSIDLSPFTAGLYIIRVYFEGVVGYGKVIKL